jgi:hypothetical protein
VGGSEMDRWLLRWSPVTGILAAALVLAALFGGGPNTPGGNAGPLNVISFFMAHGGDQKRSAILATLALIAFTLFAISLAGRVRLTGPAWLATGLVVGSALAATGFTTLIGYDWVLGSNARYLNAGSASALNLLSNDAILPVALGFCVFGITGGLAVVASRQPVRWMGWPLIVFAVCSVTPLLFIAFLATMLWTLVAAVWLVWWPRLPEDTRLAQDQPRQPAPLG